MLSRLFPFLNFIDSGSGALLLSNIYWLLSSKDLQKILLKLNMQTIIKVSSLFKSYDFIQYRVWQWSFEWFHQAASRRWFEHPLTLVFWWTCFSSLLQVSCPWSQTCDTCWGVILWWCGMSIGQESFRRTWFDLGWGSTRLWEKRCLVWSRLAFNYLID